MRTISALTWGFVAFGLLVTLNLAHVTAQDLDAPELELWQTFFNATGGPDWELCRNRYDTPCECGQIGNTGSKLVNCTDGKIIEILLADNNLVGILPVDTINSMTSLQKLIIHTNPGLELDPNSTPDYCADLTICREHSAEGPAKCRLPIHKGSLLTPCNDAASWKVFYDMTDGERWNRCKVHSETPCFCGTYPELDGKKVLCTETLSHITSLTLPNNNLVGYLPQRALAGLTQLSYLNLLDNENLQVVGPCWYMPRCAQANGPIQCEVPPHVNICAEDVIPAIGTFNPTQTPTVSPTTSPTNTPTTAERPTTQPTVSPTRSPTAFVDVSPLQLLAWKAFFDETSGSTWAQCSHSHNDPCSCSGSDGVEVVCETVTNDKGVTESQIIEISLPGIGLDGELPTNALTRISSLRALTLTNNTDLVLSIGQSCANLPRCAISETTCSLPESISVCGLTTTFAPTTVQDIDMRNWRDFYFDAGGQGWAKCSNSQDNGCSCDVNTKTRVECDADEDGSITKIILPNNGLVGLLGSRSFTPFRSLNHLNLTGNPLLRVAGDECLRLDDCIRGAITCEFDPIISVCEIESVPVNFNTSVDMLGYSFGLELFLLLGLTVLLTAILGCFITLKICGCCCFCFVDSDHFGEGKGDDRSSSRGSRR